MTRFDRHAVRREFALTLTPDQCATIKAALVLKARTIRNEVTAARGAGRPLGRPAQRLLAEVDAIETLAGTL